MKKLLVLIVVMTTLSLSQTFAQSNLDDDKVYVSVNTPDSDHHTYVMKFMMPDFETQLDLDPQYVDKISTKWKARSMVTGLNVNTTDMLVTAIISESTTDEEVLALLKMLNPNIQSVVPQ